MANPTPYNPSYSFSGWQASFPSKPLPAPQVDNELANISLSLNGTITALADIRRSDGQLKNGIVGVDALSTGISPGFVLRGTWVSGTHYLTADSVVYGGKFYRALLAHDATSLNRPDLSPATWQFLFSTVDLAGAMSIATYDPTGIGANVFARANHTGTQAISTVSGLQAALDSKADDAATTTALAAKADAAATTAALATKQDKAGLVYGEGQLALSAGNLVYSKSKGNLITVGGVHYQIPTSGISLAPSGETNGTLYYVYAYNNAGTPAILRSTTVPVFDTTLGYKVMTGDTSRTLIGMARAGAGPAWVSSTSQQFVRSWHNSQSVRMGAAYTADRSTTSSTLVEINAEIRNEFLAWAGEIAQVAFSGWGNVSGGGNAILQGSLDGSGSGMPRTGTALSTLSSLCPSGSVPLTEGYHYTTLFGSTSAGTFTLVGTGAATGLLSTVVGR